MRLLLLAALAVVSVSSVSAAQCSDAEKQRLEEFDRAWGSATMRGDRAHLQTVFADDYAGIGPAGTIGKAAAIEDAMRTFESNRANPQNAPRVTWDNYVVTCTPGTAVITHRNVIVMPSDSGERRTYVRSVHVLEKRDGRWQVVGNAGHPLASGGAADRQADVAAIRSIMQEAMAAHRAGNSERFADLFTEDGVLLPDGAPAVSGRASIAAWARTFFDAYRSAPTIEPVEIEIAGDWAFAHDAISGSLTPKAGGAAIELNAKEVAVFRRQPDGSWKVARVIFNSNNPPPRGS